ncbi:MAG: hypothetical protein ACJ75B_14115 [Flavisolibacter sp.]
MIKISLISLLIIFSCNSSGSNKIIENFTSKSDSFEQDIPELMKDNDYKNLLESVENGLGLSSIKHGFNKFQIRVWEEKNKVGQVIVLVNSGKGWSGNLYDFKYTRVNNQKVDKVMGSRSPMDTPISGWDKMLNNLYDLDILTLRDYSSIPNYDVATDVDQGYAVELAGINKYRSYTYPQPEAMQKSVPEAEKMLEIIQLLDKEFRLNNFMKRKTN